MLSAGGILFSIIYGRLSVTENTGAALSKGFVYLNLFSFNFLIKRPEVKVISPVVLIIFKRKGKARWGKKKRRRGSVASRMKLFFKQSEGLGSVPGCGQMDGLNCSFCPFHQILTTGFIRGYTKKVKYSFGKNFATPLSLWQRRRRPAVPQLRIADAPGARRLARQPLAFPLPTSPRVSARRRSGDGRLRKRNME